MDGCVEDVRLLTVSSSVRAMENKAMVKHAKTATPRRSMRVEFVGSAKGLNPGRLCGRFGGWWHKGLGALRRTSTSSDLRTHSVWFAKRGWYLRSSDVACAVSAVRVKMEAKMILCEAGAR